ncbi:hypothetical protein JL721_4652 [Aureococcus anophagefferens]|nr:hypothetical protein JL721_4652 [Aureococcus anophagefferens]
MRRTGSLSVDASKVGSRSRSCGADDGGAGLSAKAATEARTDGVARRRAWRDASARSIMVQSVDGDFLGGKCRGAKRLQGTATTLEDTNRTVAEAKGVLHDIGCKIIKEKLWLVLIIVMLTTIDGLMAYRLATNDGRLGKKK